MRPVGVKLLTPLTDIEVYRAAKTWVEGYRCVEPDIDIRVIYEAFLNDKLEAAERRPNEILHKTSKGEQAK